MKKKVKKQRTTLRPFPGGAVIAYIGNGKGKTTAAVGLAVRAHGTGMRVLFFQFFKSEEWPSGERNALKSLGVHVEVAGKGFVGILGDSKPKQEHREAAKRALERAKGHIRSGRYDVVILDESISTVENGLLTQKDIVSLLHTQKKLPKSMQPHLVLTGHEKYRTILKQCDLVTEMKKITHPYYKGFIAIKGIDF